MIHSFPFKPAMSIAELVRHTPKDGCLFVFNVNNLGTWRTTCTRLGLRCWASQPNWNRVPMCDVYITHRPEVTKVEINES